MTTHVTYIPETYDNSTTKVGQTYTTHTHKPQYTMHTIHLSPTYHTWTTKKDSTHTHIHSPYINHPYTTLSPHITPKATLHIHHAQST